MVALLIIGTIGISFDKNINPRPTEGIYIHPKIVIGNYTFNNVSEVCNYMWHTDDPNWTYGMIEKYNKDCS